MRAKAVQDMVERGARPHLLAEVAALGLAGDQGSLQLSSLLLQLSDCLVGATRLSSKLLCPAWHVSGRSVPGQACQGDLDTLMRYSKRSARYRCMDCNPALRVQHHGQSPLQAALQSRLQSAQAR